MSMADYYNGVADANMRQFWSNVGGPIGKSDAERILEEANRNMAIAHKNMDIAKAEIDKAWANYVREKKGRLFQQAWKKGFMQAMKDHLKEHFPDTWEEEWAKIYNDVDKYAVPLIYKRNEEMDNDWPNYANDERAFVKLPPWPDEVAELE